MSDPRSPHDSRTDSGEAARQVVTTEASVGVRTATDQGKIPRNFGRYRILDCLGRGGMGAVFRAHDSQLDRVVALKIPFLHDDDGGLRERFYREARAAAALHHANICPVFDVGEFQGIPYLTMAFVEGRSLAEALEAGQSFSPTLTAALVRKTALAMQTAHARGVIHRDLKPANIILRPDGEPIIMDFGLARRGDDSHGEGLTRKGDVIGTIEYMSPEQFEGNNAAVGPTSDVYALGVVLYELLTGRRPFAGGTASTVAAIILKPPPRPGELRPGIPDELENICLKAMAKQPADRYQSMAQLATALTNFLRSHQSGVTPAGSRPATAPKSPPPETQPVRAAVTPRSPGGKNDAGWELVEEPRPKSPPPPPTPRPVVRAKLIKPRKKKQKGPDRTILISVGVMLFCFSLIVGAIIIRVGANSKENPTRPNAPASMPANPTPSSPAPSTPAPSPPTAPPSVSGPEKEPGSPPPKKKKSRRKSEVNKGMN